MTQVLLYTNLDHKTQTFTKLFAGNGVGESLIQAMYIKCIARCYLKGYDFCTTLAGKLVLTILVEV